MEEDLDHILLDQLHSAQRRKKLIKRLKKLMKSDSEIDKVEYQNDLSIKYFESMIKDKNLLIKKINKKNKEKNIDVLARNPLYEAWRAAFMMTVFSYNVFTETMGRYWTFYKKDNNEKNNKES